MNVPNQWPEQTVDEPTLEDLEAMLWEGKEYLCTDGCVIETPLGTCQHLHPTWYLYRDIDPRNYGVDV